MSSTKIQPKLSDSSLHSYQEKEDVGVLVISLIVFFASKITDKVFDTNRWFTVVTEHSGEYTRRLSWEELNDKLL